jgi:signal transduction histidine kinase
MLDNKTKTERETLYLEILKSIPDPVVVCNADYKIIFVNNAFQKLFSDTIESNFIGKKLGNIVKNVTSIDCNICKSGNNSHTPENNYNHQGVILSETGKEILVRINHSILSPEKYYINTILPMSELACLDQAQLDFVSTVSHELRTPMTSIKGFADTLLCSGEQLTKDQQTRFISIIKSQADRLTRLVENLLTVSRLETKRDKSFFRALNVAYYVDRVILSLRNKHPGHAFDVKIPKDLPAIWADQDKLEQILTNLIDNAAKYSKETSVVTVQSNVLSHDSDKIEIKIIDKGVGIPDEHLSKIFNKFSRIDNPLTRHVQGTGLGLYITKSLVESLNGTISLSSNKSGTVFTVIIPVATPEKQAKNCLAEE